MEIKKGCTAIIVGGSIKETRAANVGKIVTVGNFLKKPFNNSIYDFWEINRSILFNTGKYYSMSSEKYLQRIDDENNKEEINETFEIKDEV